MYSPFHVLTVSCIATYVRLYLCAVLVERSIRAIFVSREDPESRAKSVAEIQRRVNDAGVWPNVMIFPEGTTTNKKVMLKFKLGAFVPKLPVQPVVIKFQSKLVRNKFHSEGWTFCPIYRGFLVPGEEAESYNHISTIKPSHNLIYDAGAYIVTRLNSTYMVVRFCF